MNKLLFVFVVLVLGVAAWYLGKRMSIDAITLGIGLIFGVLSGIPTALLLFGTMAQQPQRGGYSAGYAAGRNDAHREMLEADGRRLVARQSAELQRMQPPPVIIVHPPAAPPAARYTVAHPFAIQAAAQRAEHCANWDLCPDCHLPITPDEHCPEWCGVPAQTSRRQFRITGEVE